MKMLITSTILRKFEDTISEKEYQAAWEKLKDYQNDQEIIRTYNETGFQSEFLDKVFGGILGYIPRTKSLKEANLIVEHKNPNSGEKVDGAILNKDGDVKIVIELKSVKDTTAEGLVKKIRNKTEGKTPIQQTALYLFQFPQASLGIVSNFDTVIIFDRKEKFRQEYSLFDMDYDTFKEFYLILNNNSFWSGLTRLMISQSGKEEKEIDDEFFVKTTTLYKMLHNQMNEKQADDLFNKFLALAILEDNDKLKTNLINSIHDKKDDFTHTNATHWAVWVDFFKVMKGNAKKRAYLGIPDETASMNVWQDISYLGKVKVSKATLDLVVEIAQYDLWSIPALKLFFEISKSIHNPYDLVGDDNQYELFTDIMTDYLNENLATAGFQTLAFINKRVTTLDFPLVKLYNDIIQDEIVEDKDSERVIMDKICDRDNYFIFVNQYDLEDKEFIDSIRSNVFAFNLDESYLEPVVAINMRKDSGDEVYIRHIESDESVDEQGSIKRDEIGDKVIILTEEDSEWLRDYNAGSTMVGSVTLGGLVTVVPEVAGKIRFNVSTNSVVFYDEELDMWEQSFDDICEIDKTDYIYFTPKTDYAHLILASSDFEKLLRLSSVTKETILNLPISQFLMSTEFLDEARRQNELSVKINLFEFKLEQLQKTGDELSILKCEQQLDRLYEEQM